MHSLHGFIDLREFKKVLMEFLFSEEFMNVFFVHEPVHVFARTRVCLCSTPCTFCWRRLLLYYILLSSYEQLILYYKIRI